jgi:cation:H+ antiporter
MNLLAIPALIASIILISKGADWLTDSIWHISLRKRVSAGMLGMVVAGLMTTLPEVTVSGMASAMESGGISMGNAIGSTIFNILGIVGIIGLIRPLNFDRAFLRDFGRNAFVAYLAFFVLAIIGRAIDSLDAIILFCVLGASLYYGYRQRYVGAPSITPPSGTLFRDISVIVVGGVILGVGSYLLVYAAQSIASDLGIPEIIIGLSLVAVGTSIPELATGIASTRKGIEEISIGNVLGANIYNVTLVLGCASLIGVLMYDIPLIAEDSTLFFDIPVMIGATVLLMIVGRDGRISRRTSIFFLVIYGCYLGITFSGIL